MGVQQKLILLPPPSTLRCPLDIALTFSTDSPWALPLCQELGQHLGIQWGAKAGSRDLPPPPSQHGSCSEGCSSRLGSPPNHLSQAAMTASDSSVLLARGKHITLESWFCEFCFVAGNRRSDKLGPDCSSFPRCEKQVDAAFFSMFVVYHVDISCYRNLSAPFNSIPFPCTKH